MQRNSSFADRLAAGSAQRTVLEVTDWPNYAAEHSALVQAAQPNDPRSRNEP